MKVYGALVTTISEHDRLQAEIFEACKVEGFRNMDRWSRWEDAPQDAARTGRIVIFERGDRPREQAFRGRSFHPMPSEHETYTQQSDIR